MPSLRWCWLTLASCLLVFLTGNTLWTRPGYCGDVPPNGPAGPIAEMLSWLPPNTETVVAMNGPLRLEDRGRDARFSFQRIMEWLPMGEVVWQREALRDGLGGKTVRFAVQGSRCFRAPKDIGSVRYQGCDIVLFEEDAPLAATMQEALRKANRTMHLGQIPVAVFEERRQKDVWTLYFAQPKPRVALCATHEGYLRAVLERMASKPSDRALPQNLPEWKHVTAKAHVWGIRHYSKAAPQEDPTSPLQDEAAANTPDQEAVGLTFSYNPGEKRITVRYLTHSKTALDVARAGWWAHPGDGVTMNIEQIEPGVVQITGVLGRDDSGNVLLLMILGHLGHAVYL